MIIERFLKRLPLTPDALPPEWERRARWVREMGERAIALFAEPRERGAAPPDDPDAALELAIEGCADALAVLAGTALRAFPSLTLVPRSAGQSLYSALFVGSHVPAVRAKIRRRLGRRRSAFFFHLANAFALGLAERPLTASVAMVDRAARLRELRARAALWRDARFDPLRGAASLAPPAPREARPAPLREGPVERYEAKVKAVALAAFAFGLATTRNPFRAIPAVFAALPYPARHGREIFTLEVSALFAGKGMLALAPERLAVLDRIDCVVVTSDLLSGDRFQLVDALPFAGGISREEALDRARSLFKADHPLLVAKDGAWAFGPWSVVARRAPAKVRARIAERERRGALLLGLAERGLLKAVVEARVDPRRGAAEALHAASKSDLAIFVATDDSGFEVDALGARIEGILPLASLVSEIRHLQESGRGVCLVGSAPDDALTAADLSVATQPADAPLRPSAHVLAKPAPQVLQAVLDACAAARRASDESAKLAMVSAAVGALASASGRPGTASNRVFGTIAALSLAAMANGVRRGRGVGRRRPQERHPMPWHALTAEGALALLSSQRESDASRAEATGGQPGSFDARTAREIARAVALELSNPLTPLLAVGAGVSALVGSKADAGIVAGVALVNGFIGGVQRFRAERSITALIETAENRARLVGDGEVRAVPASALRPGDVVQLVRGDVVPADCRILSANGLEVDTSTLTGESLPVRKGAEPSFAENAADITSMLFEGNHIAAGCAEAVVTAVGEDTVMARAAALSVVEEERGGVEARLKDLMRLTGPLTIAAGAALIGVGLLRGKRVDELVSTAVGLAVAAVPEGLPLLAMAAQLAAAERLSKRGALVKNPRAIEALGRVDVLCADKTGTLTEGRIALAAVFDGARVQPIEALGGTGRAVLEAAVRSTAEGDGQPPDPLNDAVLRAKEEYLLAGEAGVGSRISVLPFDAVRGYEAVIEESRGGARLCIKGAPELLMAEARAVRLDRKVRFAGAAKRRFEEAVERLTAEGLRVVAVAEREIASEELEGTAARELLDRTGDLTLLGLLAFRDPLRPGAADTLRKLARAGVRVAMITGDHPRTAVAIAREAGMPGEGAALTGAEIAAMRDDELDAVVSDIAVFARVTPAQKVRIVRSLERRGHIVGMVGDGANDAAAMRAADAGIAVGLDCAEVARAAADVVLKEARIEEIFETVVEGRAMWRSVRNAVSILVGGNLGEIAFTVAAGALAGKPPLGPRQLLVVNFLTDIAPSIAIALRPPSAFDLEALREAGPEAALGATLNREIASRAVCTSLGAWTAWSAARLTGTSARASTVALLGLVGSQLGQTLLSGGANRAVLWTGLGSAALLGIMVQTPGLSQALGCTPIGPLGWGIAATASIGSTIASPLVDAAVNFVASKV